MNFKFALIVAVSSISIVGCGSTRNPVITDDKKIDTGLILIKRSLNDESAERVRENRDSAKILRDQAILELSDGEKERFGLDSKRENKILKACIGLSDQEIERLDGVPRAEFGFLIAPLIGIVIDKGISLSLEKIEKEIAEVIEEHSATYGAAVNTSAFYKGENTTNALNYPCFRFTRKRQDTLPTIDLIGQWQAATDGGAMLVRVLRVYYEDKAAERGTEIGLAVGLKANATWVDGNEGKQSDIFDKVIFSEKIDLSDQNRKRFYYPAFGKNGDLKSFDEVGIQLPLPSWSKPKPSTGPYGNVNIRVSVVEAGKPPKFLKQMKALFSDNKDKIGGILKEAANKALGIEKKE